MLRLIVDTNLFHEFRALGTLQWADLGEPIHIELIVTDVVQTELDEHKKSTRARLKRTAIRVTKQFREMLLAQKSELEIRASDPRVTLRLSDMNFGSETHGTLDLSNLDDQLVAIARKYTDKFDDGSVHLFSNDTRPMRKSVGVGVKLLVIPEEWRRADEQTDEDKERSRLTEENKRLRSREPILEVSSDPSDVLELRHAGEAEVFVCKCFVDGSAEALDEKSAVVEVLAEASNLSDPARQKLLVKFRTEQRSTIEAVSDIVLDTVSLDLG